MFVSVALMAYIKDNRVLRAFKNPVKSQGKLNHAQIAGKMTAVFCDGFDYPLSYFIT